MISSVEAEAEGAGPVTRLQPRSRPPRPRLRRLRRRRRRNRHIHKHRKKKQQQCRIQAERLEQNKSIAFRQLRDRLNCTHTAHQLQCRAQGNHGDYETAPLFPPPQHDDDQSACCKSVHSSRRFHNSIPRSVARSTSEIELTVQRQETGLDDEDDGGASRSAHSRHSRRRRHGRRGTLSAQQETSKDAGGRVRPGGAPRRRRGAITVKDDGKGLDRRRFAAKAEETGSSRPAPASPTPTVHFVFQPGFSVAPQDRRVRPRRRHGRGQTESMPARLDGLAGRRPELSLTLRLPLTLAIIEGCSSGSGATCYVVPLTAVEESVELSADEDARSRAQLPQHPRRTGAVPAPRELFAERRPDPHQKVVIVANAEVGRAGRRPDHRQPSDHDQVDFQPRADVQASPARRSSATARSR